MYFPLCFQDAHVSTLSKLTIVNKYYYDQDIKHLGHKKLKKNNEELTIVKTEFEDFHSYSDEDDTLFTEVDNKCDEKLDETDNKHDALDNKVDEPDDKCDSLDNKVVTYEDDEDDNKVLSLLSNDLSITKPELELDYAFHVKEEVEKHDIPVKVKKPRRQKDTECVNNVVGYYKRYATLVKSEKKEWGRY